MVPRSFVAKSLSFTIAKAMSYIIRLSRAFARIRAPHHGAPRYGVVFRDFRSISSLGTVRCEAKYQILARLGALVGRLVLFLWNLGNPCQSAVSSMDVHTESACRQLVSLSSGPTRVTPMLSRVLYI